MQRLRPTKDGEERALTLLRCLKDQSFTLYPCTSALCLIWRVIISAFSCFCLLPFFILSTRCKLHSFPLRSESPRPKLGLFIYLFRPNCYYVHTFNPLLSYSFILIFLLYESV